MNSMKRAVVDQGPTELLAGAKVYLAARFGRQSELREIAEEIELAGGEVTSRWLTNTDALQHADLSGTGRAAQLAMMDFADISRSQVCIAFTESRGGPSGRGGRHAELGIALALNLRVVVVGPREHVFHCLPGIEQYDSWDRARRELLGASSPSSPAPLNSQPQRAAVAVD
jgi:hypothetical protein